MRQAKIFYNAIYCGLISETDDCYNSLGNQ